MKSSKKGRSHIQEEIAELVHRIATANYGTARVRRAFSLHRGIEVNTAEQMPYLCLLAWLLDNAIGRIVELPGHNAEEFCLVFVPVVIGRSNADQLCNRRQPR